MEGSKDNLSESDSEVFGSSWQSKEILGLKTSNEVSKTSGNAFVSSSMESLQNNIFIRNMQIMTNQVDSERGSSCEPKLTTIIEFGDDKRSEGSYSKDRSVSVKDRGSNSARSEITNQRTIKIRNNRFKCK